MMEFREAEIWDAAVLSRLKRQVWDETYRGIYRDELIDGFDHRDHEARFSEKINDPGVKMFVILDGGLPVGFFSFYCCKNVHITELYVLKSHRRRGAGRSALNIVREYCLKNGVGSFTVNCNEHNLPARNFYEHMGGDLIAVDSGHEDLRRDQVTFRFSA